MRNFEDFLQEKHAEDYHGLDDEMPDAYEAWLSELEVDQMIEFADEYARKYTQEFLNKFVEESQKGL